MEPYADNFIPVISVDVVLHTPKEPFCLDSTCPCHEDQELIKQVAQQVHDGLLTPLEASHFIQGKTL